MTEPRDPYEIMADLDRIVREFATVNLEREGVVTCWVLNVATTRFDDDGDACFAYDYSVGPDTNLISAFGLAELSKRLMYETLNTEVED